MNYLKETFTVGQPSKVTACEACVYGRGAHAINCAWADENMNYGSEEEHDQ